MKNGSCVWNDPDIELLGALERLSGSTKWLPVEKGDETAAAQNHCDEMARVGYIAHWDTAGKKPWQRYTEAGGRHNVGENLDYCILPTEEMFSGEQLEGLESSFMSEKPPEDGHREQILTPQHNKLGVGLFCVWSVPNNSPRFAI